MKCIKYTKEEFLTLHEMIDVTIHNASNLTIRFNTNTKRLYLDPNMSWEDENIEKHLKKMIRLIAPPENREEFIKFAFFGNLEEAPLLVGREDNLSLLACWRLKIGR